MAVIVDQHKRSKARLVSVLIVLCAVLGLPSIAPATVEEQRARLPPSANCQDVAEGIWQAHKYIPHEGAWARVSLTIRRVSAQSNRLTGMIRGEFWEGGPSDVSPPACTPGHKHMTVEEHAEGSIEGRTIEFHGTDWRIAERQCGVWLGYNVDHYTGVIDPVLNEFASVNNDGNMAVNEPLLFRRTGCLGANVQVVSPVMPVLGVTPPPALRVRRSGCSR